MCDRSASGKCERTCSIVFSSTVCPFSRTYTPVPHLRMGAFDIMYRSKLIMLNYCFCKVRESGGGLQIFANLAKNCGMTNSAVTLQKKEDV